MLTQTRFEIFAAAALIAVLSAPLSSPAAADENVYEPIQAISQAVGSKHIAGYFVNEDGRCDVTVMVEELWDPNDDTPDFTAARLSFELQPNESATVDTAENESISLTCGDEAETLALDRPDKAYAANGK